MASLQRKDDQMVALPAGQRLGQFTHQRQFFQQGVCLTRICNWFVLVFSPLCIGHGETGRCNEIRTASERKGINLISDAVKSAEPFNCRDLQAAIVNPSDIYRQP